MSEPTREEAFSSMTAVRPMRPEDVPAVVDLHLRAFPGFFLSFLGPRFLAVLYRSAVELREIALVAAVGDRITGFAMGSADPGRFFRRLLRAHQFEFAIAALPAVARRPGTALRIARALRKPSDAAKPAGTATLLSLAVDPALQTRGQGRLLVRAFSRECGARGAACVDLTTDKFENDAVNAFYIAVGFRVGREITTPEGRVLYEYVLDLPPGDASATRGGVAGRHD
jgi:ribosomal protein S18 acetylase RimI-like enzyme